MEKEFCDCFDDHDQRLRTLENHETKFIEQIKSLCDKVDLLVKVIGAFAVIVAGAMIAQFFK